VAAVGGGWVVGWSGGAVPWAGGSAGRGNTSKR